MALLWDDQVQQMWDDNIKATNNKETNNNILAGRENLNDTLSLCEKAEHKCDGYVERGCKRLECLCNCHHVPNPNAYEFTTWGLGRLF